MSALPALVDTVELAAGGPPHVIEPGPRGTWRTLCGRDVPGSSALVARRAGLPDACGRCRRSWERLVRAEHYAGDNRGVSPGVRHASGRAAGPRTCSRCADLLDG